MAMLGMQADMRHKSHFPGCYTAWDLNLDADGTVWPEDSNVDRILRNRQYYNGSLPPSSDSNMFYNKGLLKEMMLKHEAEFRDQIHELHRLYTRQKELMEEMKKNNLYKHHCSPGTLQPNHVVSPKTSDYVQIPPHTSTSINLVHCRAPILEAKGSILPLHSYNGNRWLAGLNSTRIECSSKASEFMESNCKKFGKKILDLELPADEYFDSEDEGFSEVKTAPEVTDILANALQKIPEVGDRGDKGLSIRGSDCKSVFPESNLIPDSISSKKKVLADLNITIEREEDIISEFGDFQDPVIGHNETSLQDPPGKSNSNFRSLSEEVIPNDQIMGDPEAHSEILHLDKNKMRREGGPCNNKAGQGRSDLNSFPQDLYDEKLSIEHINNEQARDCAIPHGLDETDGKLCNENLRHVAIDFSASNCKPVAASDMRSSCRIIPSADMMNSESSIVSSRSHAFKQSPIVVQALPCFKGKSSKPSTLSPGIPENELCLGKKLLPCQKLCGASASFPQAGWQNDFQLEGQPPSASSLSLNCKNDNDSAFERSTAKYTKDFKYVRSIKGLDLNVVLPSFSTDAGSQDASHIHHENTLQNSTGCSQIAETPVHDRKPGERRDLSIPPESTLEQANSLCVHDANLEKVEASNSLDFKRMLGFHMHNEPPIANGQCSSHASPSGNHPNSCAKEDVKDEEQVSIPDINLELDHASDKEKQLDKTESVAESEPCEKCPGYGVTDLNSCLSMNKSLLMTSHSIKIDLEPPSSPENKECSPPRGESDENQLVTPVLSSGQDYGDLEEALVRNAVEAIVLISSSEIRTCFERTICEPFKASNSLYWFARVASSVVDDPGSEFGVNIGVKDYGDNDEEYLSDGIDYFEVMTLNLTEMKVEESWFKSNGQKGEEMSAIFSTNQPKRGRTRRGRQRKDFQSEILPSLTSLSRYEVTEDLQMIGGLMEAAGAQWESGPSRIVGRNGYTKGRRRSNAHASNAMESTMDASQQSGNTEVGIQQRRLIEWGKITRRPRGPRCPSSNPRLILGQV